MIQRKTELLPVRNIPYRLSRAVQPPCSVISYLINYLISYLINYLIRYLVYYLL